MAEHHEQVAVVDWWLMAYPKYAGCLFSIPNGAHLAGDSSARNKKMKKMKREGFKPGVSDLFIMIARGGYHGLFVEMKDVNKKPSAISAHQKRHIEEAIKQGYQANVCFGAKDAIDFINSYMKK